MTIKLSLITGLAGTWKRTGNLLVGCSEHAATELPNGSVLVTGGACANGNDASTEVYDPNSGTWASLRDMVSPHVSHTATRLQDGRILIAGGEDDAYEPRKAAELGANRPLSKVVSGSSSMSIRSY